MSKCQHGEKISSFCASESCLWKEAGGCASCMKKYHNHMGPTIFISEEQAQQLIKKFNVDPSTKPKCRSLQQAIFNYFNIIKTQFISFIDNACMDIINQIGHPYLTQNGLLATYKRIKKKDYKKIQQKQFRAFYQASLKVTENELIENQKRIYVDKVKKKSDFINFLEKFMKNLQTVSTEHEQNYLISHDSTINAKINDFIKIVLKGKISQSPKVNTSPSPMSPIMQNQKVQSKVKKDFKLTDKLQKVQSFPFPEINNSPSKAGENSTKVSDEVRFSETPKLSSRWKQIQKTFEKKKSKQIDNKKEKQEQKQKTIEEQKRKNRANSIDKHFVKTNNLEKKKDLEKIISDIGLNNRTILESERPELQRRFSQKQEVSPKRRAFESKQVEINEKKQKLIDMMKQKQDSSPTKTSKGQQQQVFQSNKDSNDNRISDGESSSFENQDHSQFDHTVLPRSESRQKLFQSTEMVAPKTIIVPVENKQLQNIEPEQCISPLLKYKYKSKQVQRNDIKQHTNKKTDIVLQSPNKRKQLKDELLELTDKQQKSLALLIKSLGVEAQEALIFLQSAIQYADDNLSAAEYLSYLYLQLDRPKDCLTICNKMLQKLTNSSLASEFSWHLITNRSAALNRLGRYSESIVILEECLKSKQNSKLYKNLADAYFSISIFEKSNYYYEKAVGLEDSYDEAHYNLAVCLFMQENYHNAKFSIMKALSYSPKNQVYLQLQKQINLRIKQF